MKALGWFLKCILQFLAMASPIAIALGVFTPCRVPGDEVDLPPESFNIVTIAGNAVDIGDGGQATAALLSVPFRSAFDSSGNFYLATPGIHCVRKIDTSGIITTVAGNGIAGFSGDGGQATLAQLNNPQALAWRDGYLYIAEFLNNRVRRINLATGIIMTVAGNGETILSGDGGPAIAAGIRNPQGLAFDSFGNLYIAARNNHNVRKITASLIDGVPQPMGGTEIITTVAGSAVAVGQAFSGDNGQATSARLAQTAGLAFDASGNLYVVDGVNHRIRKVTPGANGVLDGLVAKPAGGCTGATHEEVAIGNGIWCRDPDEIISTVAGSGPTGVANGAYAGDDGPATSARFNLVFDVVLRPGRLYIADTNNHRVRMVVSGADDQFTGAADEIVTTIAGTGIGGFSGDGGHAKLAQIGRSLGILLHSGNLYISDTGNQRVRKILPGADGVIQGDPDETITTFAGGGVPPSIGDNGFALLASVNFPQGLSTDDFGNVYVADANNHRIRKVDMGTGVISTVAGNGVAAFGGDGGIAISASINTPSGVTYESGNIYVADTLNSRVRKIDNSGFITTVAGSGAASFGGDGGAAKQAQLSSPNSVLFHSGNLYIVDTGNQRVRMIVPGADDEFTGTPDEVITTVAGDGTQGTAPDGSKATSGGVNNPPGGVFDSSGNLYIATSFSQRVLKVVPGANGIVEGLVMKPAGGCTGATSDEVTIGSTTWCRDPGETITTFAGFTGTPGFSGDGNPATAAQFNFMKHLAIDMSGNIYVTDTNNHAIRKVDTANTISTIAGIGGNAGFSEDGGPATSARLGSPGGVVVDFAGNVYVSDNANNISGGKLVLHNRIRRLNLAVAVDLDPDTLNIAKARGKWISAIIQFPEGRAASDVDLDSVVLQAIEPDNGSVRHAMNNEILEVGRALHSPYELLDTNGDGASDRLLLKFNRATVASWADDNPELILRVQGRMHNGQYFSGDASLRFK